MCIFLTKESDNEAKTYCPNDEPCVPHVRAFHQSNTKKKENDRITCCAVRKILKRISSYIA
jgi:hypothetical protein